MSVDQIKREYLAGGVLRLVSSECSFEYERPRPGLLFVRVAGTDIGQFGAMALDEIRSAVANEGALELFVDARRAEGVSPRVRDDWTAMFAEFRHRFSRVHVLVPGKVLELTVAVAKHLSNSERLIRIYTDPTKFEEEFNRLVA